MRAGKLDRRIYIEAKSVARDATYGSEQITWTTHAEAWAEVKDRLADSSDERVAQGQRIATRSTRVTLRWIAGVTSDMRVRLKSDGRLLQIVAIAEIGRREGLQLACEEYRAGS